MLHILQFGVTGQVAQELIRRGPAAGARIRALSRADADLADPQACTDLVAAAGPLDAVVNAAAYTAVDQAETEEATAMRINAEAPGALARACALRGVPLLHLSTDYVFDGSGSRPYREDDPVNPLGAYGRSKLAGENAVRAAGGTAVILRTSWVFSAHGRNFVRTMLRAAAERHDIAVVDDQFGGPTPAGAIADALLRIARACADGRGRPGIFHFAGTPVTTWRRFAEAIFARALTPGHRPTVRPIRTAEYPMPAVRPANSALDCARIAAAYGITPPSWPAALAEVLATLRGAKQDEHTER